MRVFALIALATATPAFGWEFSPTPVCTLSDRTAEASISVTYDPRQSEPYAISVSRQMPWPDGAIFAFVFEGSRSLTITTNRHSLSENGRTLTVTDRGFGNVLDGLEFNRTATALLQDIAVAFPLDGAAPEVQAFRACADAPSV